MVHSTPRLGKGKILPQEAQREFLGGGLVLAGEGSCHPIEVLEEESTSPG